MRPEPITLDLADATLGLLQASQRAGGAAARRFVLLDRSREVWPYHAAVLVSRARVHAHSGVAEVDPQGPHAHWLRRLAGALAGRAAGPFGVADVDPTPDGDLAEGWREAWPAHGLWLPPASASTAGAGPEAGADAGDADGDGDGDADGDGDPPGLIVVRELPWTSREAAAFARWWQLWASGDRLATQAETARRRRGRLARLGAALRGRTGRIALAGCLAVAALGAVPVPLTVRAPGEVVPRQPVVVRAAIDGQVRRLAVEPNQPVKAGDLLAELDDGLWRSRLEVARQALGTADAEWRQVGQQALADPRAKGQLAAVQGRVLEKRAELAFVQDQLERTRLRAPADGVVLLQDPGGWIGRTVSAGEPLMKLAAPDDREVEAWVAVGDAVDLPAGARMALHPAASAGPPMQARLRLFAYEAEQRPDLGLGYRVRGTPEPGGSARLGTRGTVRIEGPRVPLAAWVLRRPLAAAREVTGW